MTDMIERVARAIVGVTDQEWEDENEAWREFYRAIARAAIAAMREPSETMVDAAWASWEDPEGSKGFVGAWQAMIDIALDEKS